MSHKSVSERRVVFCEDLVLRLICHLLLNSVTHVLQWTENALSLSVSVQIDG
jgi:hypothetical protein